LIPGNGDLVSNNTNFSINNVFRGSGKTIEEKPLSGQETFGNRVSNPATLKTFLRDDKQPSIKNYVMKMSSKMNLPINQEQSLDSTRATRKRRQIPPS
jgi:hypothetical protein